MKIWDCKCEDCKAEFQAVLEGVDDIVICPSCDSKKVSLTETELELGCGGGCGSCGGCGAETETK